jgi:sugar phosphate permease
MGRYKGNDGCAAIILLIAAIATVIGIAQTMVQNTHDSILSALFCMAIVGLIIYGIYWVSKKSN